MSPVPVWHSLPSPWIFDTFGQQNLHLFIREALLSKAVKQSNHERWRLDRKQEAHHNWTPKSELMLHARLATKWSNSINCKNSHIIISYSCKSQVYINTCFKMLMFSGQRMDAGEGMTLYIRCTLSDNMSKPFLADVLVHNINCNYKQIYKHFVSRCEWVFKWVCALCTVRGLKIRHCVLCVLWYFSAQHGSKEWLLYVIVTFLSAWTSIWLPLHFCWMFFVFCTIVKTLVAVKCENKKISCF